ncbi:MAG: HD-GYP domain-containing protein [Dehalococcoidia bacterium]
MSQHSRKTLEQVAIVGATIGIGGLVIWDGVLPSVYTNLFLIPISFAAWRHTLGWATAVAVLAGVIASPALTPLGVEMHSSLRPVLWLGWPAVYLLFAVTFNQWAGLRRQKDDIQTVEQGLVISEIRNQGREDELKTLGSLYDAILRGEDEQTLGVETTRRAAVLTGAKACAIVTPDGRRGERPLFSYGYNPDDFDRIFPDGAPYGEGVEGWAMLHRRVTWSPNVFQDARYDRLRLFAQQVGYKAEAAAPIEFDGDLFGVLVVCYEEEREFSSDELARLERLANQAALAFRSARQRENLSHFAYETAVALTEAIESRDPYTGGHCHRLADRAVMLGRHMSLPWPELEVLGLGAALHDVGKIVVPDSILMKPDKLTPLEFATVKQHCYSGGQICKRVPFLREAQPIVYHHHERFDGSGYPDGLSGGEIPLGARIVAVADAFDAMTSDRPYRKALSEQDAKLVLREGVGQQWDPSVVEAMMDVTNGSSHESEEAVQKGQPA